MLRASFYVLNHADAERRFLTLCKLTAKAIASSQRVYIQAQDEADAIQCDEWLWSFQAESFLPHHRVGDGPFVAAPILIALQTPAESDGICINLSQRNINNLAQFQRILELVTSAEPARQAARQRWLYYKQQGFTLEKHDL